MSYEQQFVLKCDQCGKTLIDKEGTFHPRIIGSLMPAGWVSILVGVHGNESVIRHLCDNHEVRVDGKDCAGG